MSMQEEAEYLTVASGFETAALRELEAANASPVPKKASVPHRAYPSQNGAMYDHLPPSPWELPAAREAAREVSFQASLSRISMQGPTTLPHHSDKVPALSSLVGKHGEADAPTGPQGHSNGHSNGSSTPASESGGGSGLPTNGRKDMQLPIQKDMQLPMLKDMKLPIQTKSQKHCTASASLISNSSSSSLSSFRERVQAQETACLQGYDPGLICLRCDIH